MESGEKNLTPPEKRQPFNMNIKAFKRMLDEQGVPKSARNAAIKQYKEKVYTRVAEVKAKMEKEMLDASDK